MSKTDTKKEEQPEKSTQEELRICGIVMPISPIEGYPPTQWDDVIAIIESVVTEAGLQPKLVSYGDESGIIHARIVRNLAENPLVICDVSGKNPNVMFELGMRLAFDKPTIVIKDDKTNYSFDTSPIEHIPYPSDLRHNAMEAFKILLKAKIVETLKAADADPEYSTFLKEFVRYKKDLKTEEVNNQTYNEKLLESLLNRFDSFEKEFIAQSANTNKVVQTTSPALSVRMRSLFYNVYVRSYPITDAAKVDMEQYINHFVDFFRVNDYGTANRYSRQRLHETAKEIVFAYIEKD